MKSRRPSYSRQVFGSRNFGLAGVVMFGRYRNAASQSGLLPHSHPDAIEICFLERGEQSYRVDGMVHRLRGNDQFFTLPGEVHDTARLPQERGILYWLILRLETSRDFLGLATAPARRLKDILRRMPTRLFRAHRDCPRILSEMIDLLERISRARGNRSSSPLQMRLQALLLQYLTLTIEASYRNSRDSASPVIQRVLHYITAHLEDPIQVARLAEAAKLSESRFKNRFKRETGVPPAEFWLRKKIERAVPMLKIKSVTNVAYELGFSSSQYFATAFKRYTLANPSQFAPTFRSSKRRPPIAPA